MVANGINKLARERCYAAETLQKIQRNASRCMKRFGYEKISRDIALADILVERRRDGIVTIWLHRKLLSTGLTKWIVRISKVSGRAKNDKRETRARLSNAPV